jgi:hypothetical protein
MSEQVSNTNTPTYTTQRVNVPSQLPTILKQYTKALIKTQPPNYIAWSAAYFSALAENRPLPIKPRLEAADGSNLTIGLLEIIVDQIGQTNGPVSLAKIDARWADLGLHEIDLADTLIRARMINDIKDIQEDPAMEIDIQKFITAAAMQIAGKTDLVGTMDIVCQILAADPSDRYHGTRFDIFARNYKFIAKTCDIPQEVQDKALRYLNAKSEANNGLLLPGAMFAETCPPLNGPQD